MKSTQVETGLKIWRLKESNNIPSHKNRLSVQVTLTGLSFLVTSLPKKETIYFTEHSYPSQYTHHDILAALEKEIRENDVLQNCGEVNLLYANTDYTLVPQTLFDESKLSEYLKFNSKILAGDYLAYDTVVEQSLSVVYVPMMSINNFLFEKFGTFNYYHSATILLKHIFNNSKSQEQHQAYVNCYKDHFDLVLLKSGKLQLCNSYKYRTSEDLIYYILFAFEQHEVNPNNIPVSVFGNITEADENFEILYKYIRNLEITNLDKSLLALETAASHNNILLKTIV